VAHLTLLSLILSCPSSTYIEGSPREACSRVRGRPEHDVENYGSNLLGEVSALQMHGPTCTQGAHRIGWSRGFRVDASRETPDVSDVTKSEDLSHL